MGLFIYKMDTSQVHISDNSGWKETFFSLPLEQLNMFLASTCVLIIVQHTKWCLFSKFKGEVQ